MYLPITINTVSNESVGVSLLEPNPVGETDETLANITEQHAWHLEVVGSQEIELILPLDEGITYLRPSLAFSSNGSPFTLMSPLANQNGFGLSNTFLASSGIVTVAEAATTEEVPSLKVFNLVTPNGDGMHDYLKIENIEFYPDNELSIFNRWGDQLFSINGYDNVDSVFKGISNKTNSLLSDGTYYYVIEDGKGKKYSGFFVLRN